jgi:hypothetical protein
LLVALAILAVYGRKEILSQSMSRGQENADPGAYPKPIRWRFKRMKNPAEDVTSREIGSGLQL